MNYGAVPLLRLGAIWPQCATQTVLPTPALSRQTIRGIPAHPRKHRSAMVGSFMAEGTKRRSPGTLIARRHVPFVIVPRFGSSQLRVLAQARDLYSNVDQLQ